MLTKTPRQVARDMLFHALNGRMDELFSEVRDNEPKATDREEGEVQRYLNKYIERMTAMVVK